MKAMRCLLVLLGLLGARSAHAQFLGWPGPFGIGAVAAGGAIVARGRHFSAFVGGYRWNSYPLSPYYLPPPSRVNLYYSYAPPPIVVFNVPRPDWDDPVEELRQQLAMRRFLVEPPRQELPRQELPRQEPPRPGPPADEAPLPGRPAGGFRPVLPEDRMNAQKPPKPQPAPPAAPEPMPPLPIERVDTNPLVEQARQLALGKEAFSQRAFGLAAQHFRQATFAAPQDPQGFFALAEALAALGKYRDAVRAIHDGMRLRPDWPTQPFQPVEYFQGIPADYAEMLRTLEELLTSRRDDAVLLFLYAYHLWFDGRKDEARVLFLRAAAVVPDRSDCDRFLQRP